MKRTTEKGPHGDPAKLAEPISLAGRELETLRADLRRALRRLDAAIALLAAPEASADRPSRGAPPGEPGRARRPAPPREPGTRGRRAPVLPGTRKPPPAVGEAPEPSQDPDE